MEAVDSGSRHSGISALINHDRQPEPVERTYPPPTGMAAAAVISQPSMYSNGPPPPPPPPYSSSWSHHPPPPHSLSGLISPPESRRTSDNNHEPPPLQTAPQRQSLPSIHEALNSGPKPTSSYTSPVSTGPPHPQMPYTQSQKPSMPRPYSEHPPYSAPPQRHNSPPQPAPPVHTQNPFSRAEPMPSSFPENRHPSTSSLQAAPAPPPNPYAAPPAPRFDAPRYEPEPRPSERPQPNGYASHTSQGPYGYPSGSVAPSSDSGYTSSQPGPHGSSHNQPRYQQREGRQSGDWAYGGQPDVKKMEPPFATAMKRHLDIWDFENSLAQVNASSGALRSWSAHYGSIAQEQQRTTTIPERMPSLEDCNEMMAHNQKIQGALQWMKETIYQQEHALADQRMREQGGKDYDADDMSIYGDDMKSQGFGGSESKKRRGRAAHPGRCHSCNRAETPEWRRGPDGARTLCNACGLHYAKLTRKNNTMKQSQGSNGTGSQLRPKSMDDHSPRPL
ncbi:GATA zinc finger domain-containing protein 10 [Phlyctema vagabunda]|uniref:GATA zinc finger domain-containing protein 10 n=1 Tax=Phlyctema vagabunda TaxID=108571 RepID=A0ABR4PGY6_9HELO